MDSRHAFAVAARLGSSLCLGLTMILALGCASDDDKSPSGSSSSSSGSGSSSSSSSGSSTSSTSSGGDGSGDEDGGGGSGGLPACDIDACDRVTASDDKCASSAPYVSAIVCDSSKQLSPNCKPVEPMEGGKVLWCCPCE